MALPIKTFWLLSGNVERISAQKDIRSFSVSSHCQDSEGSTAFRERLVLEIGETVKMEPGAETLAAVDVEGLEDLRKMAQQQ